MNKEKIQKPRARDLPGAPSEIDVIGAGARIYKKGKAIDFLSANQSQQIAMLRKDDTNLVKPIEDEVAILLRTVLNYSDREKIQKTLDRTQADASKRASHWIQKLQEGLNRWKN